MKVRAIQFSPILGNVSSNLDFHIEKIKLAISDKMDLIVFPELSLSGYHLKDIIHDAALGLEGNEIKHLKNLSKEVDIVVGAPIEERPGFVFNSALYFSGGDLLHIHRKVTLSNTEAFQEGKIFTAGDIFQSFRIRDFTIGLLIGSANSIQVNAYLYFLQKTDFLIGISGTPLIRAEQEGFPASKFCENMGYSFAVLYHQNYIFVNRTGVEEGIRFGGGSFFARPGKGIDKKAKYIDDDTLDVEINLEDVRKSRISSHYARDENPGVIFKEFKRILNIPG